MATDKVSDREAWLALAALLVGFFMILVDGTIVTVATPTIMADFDASVTHVMWVSSAFLLAFVVPLLFMARLGDWLGPKVVYQGGLVVFTLASLICGLTTSIEGLIAARALQGLGASMMNPQSMATITRLFPAGRRGRAMAIWGSIAGLASLAGPLLGGVLIDIAGWPWIFFVNVPIGVVCFVLVQLWVPRFTVARHRFDILGIALSALALTALTVGFQEADAYNWGTITRGISVWGLIITGVALMAAFVLWEHRNRNEPLIPLDMFSARNFSVANLAIACVGFGVTSMPFVLMLWAQSARGLSPTRAALVTAPSAIMTLIVSPLVGRLIDQVHPRLLASLGALGWALGIGWTALVMYHDGPVWQVLLPSALMGLAGSFVWGPLSTSATATLPVNRAGAGAGVYNTTRQIGSVIGSAIIATVINDRLATATTGEASISRALGQAMAVPAIALLGATLVAMLLVRPTHQRAGH